MSIPEYQPRKHHSVTADDVRRLLSEVQSITGNTIHKEYILGAFHVLELRRQNDLFVEDRDIFDEQLGALSDDLSLVAAALNDIAAALELLVGSNGVLSVSTDSA